MVVTVRDRYVVFHIHPPSSIPTLSDLKNKIWNKYQLIFGLSGTSEAGLYFESYDENTGLGIVRCTSKSLSSLMKIFAVITHITDIEVMIQVLFISGLLKKANAFLSNQGSQNHNVD